MNSILKSMVLVDENNTNIIVGYRVETTEGTFDIPTNLTDSVFFNKNFITSVVPMKNHNGVWVSQDELNNNVTYKMITNPTELNLLNYVQTEKKVDTKTKERYDRLVNALANGVTLGGNIATEGDIVNMRSELELLKETMEL